jgi:hypothetical protein
MFTLYIKRFDGPIRKVAARVIDWMDWWLRQWKTYRGGLDDVIGAEWRVHSGDRELTSR